MAAELWQLSCHPPGLKGMRRARHKDVDLTSEAAQQQAWRACQLLQDTGEPQMDPKAGNQRNNNILTSFSFPCSWISGLKGPQLITLIWVSGGMGVKGHCRDPGRLPPPFPSEQGEGVGAWRGLWRAPDPCPHLSTPLETSCHLTHLTDRAWSVPSVSFYFEF